MIFLFSFLESFSLNFNVFILSSLTSYYFILHSSFWGVVKVHEAVPLLGNAHLEHLTMPLRPGILHPPISLLCKAQWCLDQVAQSCSDLFSCAPGQQLEEVSPFFCSTLCSPCTNRRPLGSWSPTETGGRYLEIGSLFSTPAISGTTSWTWCWCIRGLSFFPKVN